MTRVSFEAALWRFGCSILTPGSAIALRPYNLAAVRAAIATRTHIAGVAELVDARGLGPRGHKPWGFESLRPHSCCRVASPTLMHSEPLFAAYKRRTMELLDPQPGGRYLDIGTGTAAGALACAERFNVAVVGVDSSQVMIEEATRRGLTEAAGRRAPRDRDSRAGALRAHDFTGTNESTSATLARWAIEMLRGLDCVQRIPSRSQYSQNSPRMSSERFEKNQRG